MVYSPSYATFTNLPAGRLFAASFPGFWITYAIHVLDSLFVTSYRSGEGRGVSETSSSTLSLEEDSPSHLKHKSESCSARDTGLKATASLLDLYSGCGAMSTGLCFGAQLSGMNLETVCGIFFYFWFLKISAINSFLINFDILELSLCRNGLLTSTNMHVKAWRWIILMWRYCY